MAVSTAEGRFGAQALQRLMAESCDAQPGPGTALAILAKVDRPAEAWTGFSAFECEAMARLRRPDDRAAYAMAHGLLRRAVLRLMGEPGKALTLAYAPGGRPFLAGYEALSVSLSHARSHVAVAIGWDVAVGIDVEPLSGGAPDGGVMEEALTARERALVDAAGAGEAQERCFLRLWTAKEAILKAHGLGLPAGLQQVCLADGYDRPRITLPDALDLQVALFEPAGAVCVLAVERNIKQLIVEHHPVP